MPLPNVNMAVGGYGERGTDVSLPAAMYAETVTNPSLWPLGLDGCARGKGAPSADIIALARKARSDLDVQSVFGQTFANSEAMKRWLAQREGGAGLEAQDLITRLNVLPDLPPQIPLSQYGLAPLPMVRECDRSFQTSSMIRSKVKRRWRSCSSSIESPQQSRSVRTSM
jgi:hypothetical protein